MNEPKSINVGITGQSGFMGTHLFNFIGIKEDITRIPFVDDYFSNISKLDEFIGKCDVIVHLAAMNRHGDPKIIYATNIRLVKDLIEACERTNSKPHIIFSSSTQESLNNLYGKSKKDGKKLFEKWAEENSALFTGLIIPNVFGPFGNPHYNSVIATFCHQLTHEEKPKIQIDGDLKLIYINELIDEFYKAITNNLNIKEEKASRSYEVLHTSVYKVSEILKILTRFKNVYFDQGIIPQIDNKFELSLFNTFRCYFPKQKFPFLFKENIDDRGAFVEIIRTNTSGQYSYSTTKPGITRGNHFHTRKIERFAVIKGNARIVLRRVGSDDVISYELSGNQPSFVDIPIWHIHNITNIGAKELITLFWINEPYNPDDPDTYFEKV
ncbi:MAG TPA: NAD-dependent epimerase/dehydratase family protein [Ignavibacteria bacterium]